MCVPMIFRRKKDPEKKKKKKKTCFYAYVWLEIRTEI